MASEITNLTVDRARWEPPKARIIDTALDEDKMLVAALCNNSIQETMVEAAATLVLSSIMETAPKGEYKKVLDSYDEVYKKEIAKLTAITNREEREKIAGSRTWLKLLGEAKITHFAKFTRAQGNEVALAVIREKTHDRKGNDEIIVDIQDKDNPFAAVKKTLVLARVIARQITHENQDATVVIVGSKGKGKSWFALELAEAVARELSIIFYRNEDHWLDYWNYKEDTAIIDDDSILNLLQKKTGKHHIKILDDVGYSKGIDSRKWASKENDEANSTVSINRTENGLTIYTSQSHFFIDKKIRLLLTNYIEVTGPKNEETGINMAKLHDMTLHPRDGDDPIYYPFIYRTWNDKETDEEHTLVHPILCCGVPSREIIEWYEPARSKAAEDSIMKKRKGTNQAPPIDDTPKKPFNLSSDGQVKCPNCGSVQYKWIKKFNHFHCNKCGKDHE